MLRRFAPCLAVLLVALPAAAQVPVRPVAEALSGAGSLPGRSSFARARVPSIIRVPVGGRARGAGFQPVGDTFGVRAAPLGELAELSRAHPDWQVTWSAPLRPLADRAGEWVGLPGFRRDTGRTGRGVLVGVADTGVDVSHPDLRNRDGTTRLAYLIDFSRPGEGRYPEAEARCVAAGLECAVTDAAEIDQRLSRGAAGLPVDMEGHGTHVASLAAGNGGVGARYAGLASEARLLVASVKDASGSISDAAVLLAVDLMFFLAEQEGQREGRERLPLVVNLSLGSDFGPHDGTAALDLALGELVGPEFPGRSIVVAAGNSGSLLAAKSAFPDPLGVHTDVHVPDGSSVRVPIVAFPPSGAGEDLAASLHVWITFRPGDEVFVGVDRRSGRFIDPIAPGERGVRTTDGKLAVTVLNGVAGTPDGPRPYAAAVLVEGSWPRSETFAIRLEGRGTASLWIQSEGDLLPVGTDLGALFPAATREGTVTLPATSPALIAVGATLNRTEWTDRRGDAHGVESFGGQADPVADTIAFFSSAGPTTDSRMKPDLLAPGAFVVGAMSRRADPATSGFSIFHGGPCGPAPDCRVVDDAHAVSTGTSMSAPIVAGAVALLFEAEPGLTQGAILEKLQAGARRPRGPVETGAQAGAGVLDLEGILDTEQATKSGRTATPSPRESWLTLGQTLARPDPGWPIPAVLQLRGADGTRAALPDPAALDIEVENGRLVGDVRSGLPGFHAFSVAANAGTGGATLRVIVRSEGVEIARASLPIAVDTGAWRGGFFARGGCSIGAPAPRHDGRAPAPGVLIGAALLASSLAFRGPWAARRHRRVR